jgi:hypothetical protein
VHTAQGEVRGASAAPGVAVFKGIPFAAAPVGNLRFREAQPPQPWSGVLDGTKWGNTCIQPKAPTRPIGVNQATDMPDSPPMSEDCLNLNVWTPAHERRRQAAGDGVVLRRRVQRGRRLDAVRRRHQPRQEGRDRHFAQLPRRRVRLPVASRADRRLAAPRLGQPGPVGFDRRAALGAGEHRRVRRRPGQRDDLRPVGGARASPRR